MALIDKDIFNAISFWNVWQSIEVVCRNTRRKKYSTMIQEDVLVKRSVI